MKLRQKLTVTQVTLTPGKESVTFQAQYALVDDSGGNEILVMSLPYGSVTKEVPADIAGKFSVGAEFTS